MENVIKEFEKKCRIDYQDQKRIKNNFDVQLRNSSSFKLGSLKKEDFAKNMYYSFNNSTNRRATTKKMQIVMLSLLDKVGIDKFNSEQIRIIERISQFKPKDRMKKEALIQMTYVFEMVLEKVTPEQLEENINSLEYKDFYKNKEVPNNSQLLAKLKQSSNVKTMGSKIGDVIDKVGHAWEKKDGENSYNEDPDLDEFNIKNEVSDKQILSFRKIEKLQTTQEQKEDYKLRLIEIDKTSPRSLKRELINKELEKIQDYNKSLYKRIEQEDTTQEQKQILKLEILANKKLRSSERREFKQEELDSRYNTSVSLSDRHEEKIIRLRKEGNLTPEQEKLFNDEGKVLERTVEIHKKFSKDNEIKIENDRLTVENSNLKIARIEILNNNIEENKEEILQEIDKQILQNNEEIKHNNKEKEKIFNWWKENKEKISNETRQMISYYEQEMNKIIQQQEQIRQEVVEINKEYTKQKKQIHSVQPVDNEKLKQLEEELNENEIIKKNNFLEKKVDEFKLKIKNQEDLLVELDRGSQKILKEQEEENILNEQEKTAMHINKEVQKIQEPKTFTNELEKRNSPTRKNTNTNRR